ncbi:GNAT family N-acetyltransferase [bacterium]|nr:GNAT family N-acetyltransferase [bacterium]
MDQPPNIRPLEKKDLESVNCLFTDVFKKKRTIEHWKWKYFSNPHGAPVVSVAIKEGTVIGFYGLLPRKLLFYGTTSTAYQEVDLMVHPDHARGGLFKRLGMESYDQVKKNNDPFTFGFPNQTSLPLGRRILGWRAIKPIPLWTILLHPAEALAGKIPNVPGANFLGNVSFSLYHRARLGCYSFHEAGLYEIRIIEDIPADLTGLSTGSRAMFEFVRDRKYLQWRYSQHPDKKYRIYSANNDRGCVGLAIVGISADGRANLCEFLLDSDHAAAGSALIRYVSADCINEGCHTLRAWALAGNNEATMFSKLGFLNRNALNYHVIRSFKSPEINRRLWDPALWYISAGDSDCV